MEIRAAIIQPTFEQIIAERDKLREQLRLAVEVLKVMNCQGRRRDMVRKAIETLKK